MRAWDTGEKEKDICPIPIRKQINVKVFEIQKRIFGHTYSQPAASTQPRKGKA